MSDLQEDAGAQPHTAAQSFTHNLIAGGVAGISVDVALFPLDTIKTRMQSRTGFFASGGFKGIYRGLQTTAFGSAPGAALFFTTYEYSKSAVQQYAAPGQRNESLVHCAAACAGETVACLVRVPTENIKQKLQVGHYNTIAVTSQAIVQQSGVRGFYAGYATTLMREIPFSLIQFPLYEYGKKRYAAYAHRTCLPYESAVIGSLAGAVAAAVTTPFDVAKTRIMLNQHNNMSMYSVMRSVYAEGGLKQLFSGVQPRVAWISIGGFVFFGSYEAAHAALNKVT